MRSTVGHTTSSRRRSLCSSIARLSRRSITIGSDVAGAKVVVDERKEPMTAESVRIQNLSGFNGMYSQGGGGDATMSHNNGRFTITGTANGYRVDKPGEPASATFKVIAEC